ncbi:sensor histidine kinase [Streptomyces albipurpureus]|uniref:histidine kinase n=1 Tax=Streptomyces albipurpureus TaxID=2897419 RepID=A0ABT0UGV6_9ACTN|nr:HAMP domain-containing sensor histidine kinase [Streptomyces sp. CWNU-1]MCM2387853.1 HAMP domain-containing histidine kinase [Streptomyces sp. CWNU-1]
MRSVRAKAAIGATLVVAIALITTGLGLLLVLRQSLEGKINLQAEIAAREVASQFALDTPPDQLDLPGGEDRPIQVVAPKAQVIAVSPGLQSISGTSTGKTAPTPLPSPSAEKDDTSDQGQQPDQENDADNDQDTDQDNEPDQPEPDTELDDPDDDPARGQVSSREEFSDGTANVDGDSASYRFAAVEATNRAGTTVTVYAGAPRATEQDTVESVRDAMLIGLPALLLVVGSVTWLVTRHALKPVEGIRGEMAAITASEDLSRRVPEPDSRDEIARLARTTNETLAALEASVERQRRFVADASHELRSPIASLRTQLEVGQAHPELLDVPGAVADTVRLQQLAADLLLLARLDAGERPGQARLDLGALVREEASQRANDRIPVTVDAAVGLEVTGSRSQLVRVLGNLLDNAQRHADSSVTAVVREDGGDIVLTVEDDGDGVPEDERERIFERFVRLDDARSRDDGGAGLGLAIARDVAARHGGTLTVGVGERGGALFELRLPG